VEHFTDYLGWQRGQLLYRLAQIAEELASVYREIGLSKAGEYEERREMWMNPRESSVTARDSDARYASATYTLSLIELEAQERALVEEKFLVIRLLETQCQTSHTPTSSTG
jgi:hypothetical protein